MKKIFFVIAAIVVSLLLHSCGNDYNDVLEIDNSIIQTRALNVDSIDKGEIIPVPESPHKRKDLSLYFINENSSFFDIRELPVNIIVRENTHNSEARYLTSNGVQSEVSMEPRNDSDNQKFKLYIMPLYTSRIIKIICCLWEYILMLQMYVFYILKMELLLRELAGIFSRESKERNLIY